MFNQLCQDPLQHQRLYQVAAIERFDAPPSELIGRKLLDGARRRLYERTIYWQAVAGPIAKELNLDEIDINPALAPEQRCHLQELLKKYYYIFAHNKQDLGQVTAVQHRINTGNAAPIHQAPYRTSFAA